MFCNMCGKNLPDDAKFCLGCGAKTRIAIEQAPKAPNYIRAEEQICRFCGGVYSRYAGKCPHCNRVTAYAVNKTSAPAVKREAFDTVKKRICGKCNEPNSMASMTCIKCGEELPLDSQVVTYRSPIKKKREFSVGVKVWLILCAIAAFLSIIPTLTGYLSMPEQVHALLPSYGIYIMIGIILVIIIGVSYIILCSAMKKSAFFTLVVCRCLDLISAILLLNTLNPLVEVSLLNGMVAGSVVGVIVNIAITFALIKKYWNDME